MKQKQYQVIERDPSAGITVAQSDEHQRNWNDEQWEKKINSPGANYDRSRAEQNFEIRSGRVQTVQKDISITERMKTRIMELGIIDPNEARRNKNIRTVANFIFEGSRERMHELAFGDQKVNLERGADNSHIVRCKGIEDWALDTYRWVAEKYGEENIMGFYVHLDEVDPHVHCTVLPITPQNKFSWKYHFGSTIEEGRQILKELHDDYYEKVGKKYGLERGEDKRQTGAVHKSTGQYREEAARLERDISGLNKEKETAQTELNDIRQQIRILGKKVAALKTMISNFEKQRDDIEAEIASIRAKIGSTNDDSAREFWMKIQSLNEKLKIIDEKIAEKQTTLADAQKQLHEAMAERDKQRLVADALKKSNADTIRTIDIKTQRDLSNISVAMLAEKMSTLLPSLNANQRNSIAAFGGNPGATSSVIGQSDLSFLDALANNSAEVMQCATLLFLGYIQQATNYSVSHGGAQGPGTGWRKRDDEDDFLFGKRCIGMAAKMMKGVKKSRRR